MIIAQAHLGEQPLRKAPSKWLRGLLEPPQLWIHPYLRQIFTTKNTLPDEILKFAVDLYLLLNNHDVRTKKNPSSLADLRWFQWLYHQVVLFLFY